MKTRMLSVCAPRRGLHEITAELSRLVSESGVKEGLCNIFIRHTSASLIIQENYDASARRDLETFLDRLAPAGAAWMTHTLEGPDDMPSHLKSILTQVNLTIPVLEGRLGLGTWQGVYLWEHREDPTPRELVVSVF